MDEDNNYAPLPSRVEFRKIISNVMNSLNFLHRESEEESKFDRWIKYLEIEENKAIVSDLFWYSICKYFNKDKYVEN